MGLIRMLAMGISTGTVALVSRLVGEKNHEAARDVVGQSVVLSVACSVAVAFQGTEDRGARDDVQSQEAVRGRRPRGQVQGQPGIRRVAGGPAGFTEPGFAAVSISSGGVTKGTWKIDWYIVNRDTREVRHVATNTFITTW